ncbi:MAG: hypothetical protein ACREJ2_00690 [Planctomycetota bacterium]
MTPAVFLSLMGAVVILLIASAVYGYMANQKRIAAFQAVALQANLQFQAGRGGRTFDYPPFQQGDNRYAENTLTGTWKDRDLQMGDFHYETHSTDSKGNRQTQHHHFSYCHLATPEAVFGQLFIRPEGLWDKLTALVGFADINFESAEFSKKFYVKSPDRKFAYDIISQGMMNFLLAHPQYTIHLTLEGLLVLERHARWDPEEFLVHAEFAAEFLTTIPQFAWEEYRK